MIALAAHLKFYLYPQATDMRKSFDGLSGIVTAVLARDPMSGEVYIFVNRRRDRMKLLLWDRTGFWLFYKRLEQGTFQLPAQANQHAAIDLPYEELLLILEGIDLSFIKRRPRYHHPVPSPQLQAYP
ncbi:MAG: IS66 family insertion sequence element accessory protein TnpB [Candidatus Rokuibacteriota bacterium]